MSLHSSGWIVHAPTAGYRKKQLAPQMNSELKKDV